MLLTIEGGKQRAAAITEASATADDTTTSPTDVLMADMTVTPGAGDYMVWFSTSVEDSAANGVVGVSLYINGVQVARTERTYQNAQHGPTTTPLAFQTAVTGVLDAQAVEVRWRTDSGTATAHQRTLTVLRVGA
jgi:hypothetical protein